METRKGREVKRINELLSADPNREEGVKAVTEEDDDEITELENKIKKSTEEHKKEIEEKVETKEDPLLDDRELLLEKREADVARAEKQFSKMGNAIPPVPGVDHAYVVNIPDEQKILSATKKEEYEEQINEAEVSLLEEKNMHPTDRKNKKETINMLKLRIAESNIIGPRLEKQRLDKLQAQVVRVYQRIKNSFRDKKIEISAVTKLSNDHVPNSRELSFLLSLLFKNTDILNKYFQKIIDAEDETSDMLAGAHHLKEAGRDIDPKDFEVIGCSIELESAITKLSGMVPNKEYSTRRFHAQFRELMQSYIK